MNVRQNKDGSDLSSFLPKEIQGWKAEPEDHLYDQQTIFSYIDGAGEVYRSYNFKQLLARRYRKDGKADIIADFFDMGTPADAFGVFTHDLDGEDINIGQESTYNGGLLSFWRDRYFVSLYAEAETAETKNALAALGKQIAAAIGRNGPKPALLNLLPAEYADAKAVRYFHNHLILNYHFFVSDENILRLDETTEVVLSKAGEKGRKSALLIVKYSAANKATEAYKNFLKVYMPDAKEPGLVQTEDKKWTAAGAWNDLVAVVFSAPTRAAAKEILTKVEKKIK